MSLVRVRRARSLTLAWRDSALVVQNYMTRRVAPLTPLLVEVLDRCGDWQTVDALCQQCPELTARQVREAVRLLVSFTFLDRRHGRGRRSDAPDPWDVWAPEAAQFHFATKDVIYGEPKASRRVLLDRMPSDPPPPPLKTAAGPGWRLPPPARLGSLDEALDTRRTWRRFARTALSPSQLASLLYHTWGVRAWAHTDLGPAALKSSPSGGARHSIEVYVLARHVDGLPRGCYHYAPNRHELTAVAEGLSSRTLERLLAGQTCYRDVPAVFVMTSVFARVQWKYDFPRAYRVVLLDAGHLAQTFCLAATALGLAPFSTAALADSAIERTLGLDGVTESVIYACGVGHRPPGVVWAPKADTEAPKLTLPAWRRAVRS